MVKEILGKKLGMSQIFRADGEIVPVTVLQAGPCVVVQRKSATKNGYEAAQLALIERAQRHPTKAMRGHFAKANVAPMRFIREVRLEPSAADTKEGDSVKVDLFQPKDRVNVVGVSKGRGFAGSVKRHHFGGGDRSHGSMSHRAPGSIGSSAFPSRVFKGMRAAGHMGAERVTVRNLEVMRIDPEENLLMVKGSVPGPNGGYLIIKKVTAAR